MNDITKNKDFRLFAAIHVPASRTAVTTTRFAGRPQMTWSQPIIVFRTGLALHALFRLGGI
jgi:hypothetical protein